MSSRASADRVHSPAIECGHGFSLAFSQSLRKFLAAKTSRLYNASDSYKMRSVESERFFHGIWWCVANGKIDALRASIQTVFLGQSRSVDLLLIGLFARD